MQRINTLSTSTIIIATIVSVMIVLGFSSVMATQMDPMPVKISYHDLSPKAKQQVECLAQNIYFESGHESEEGQIAVGMVTMNRVKSGIFPDTICGVVKQKTQSTCQFSWFCEGKFDVKSLTHFNHSLYNSVRELAVYVYANHDKIEDPSKGALFYHADYVHPHWKNVTYLTQIGRHKFYDKKEIK
jgi:spore germination cell wall hydrolase CwlJ-like protein